jgi:predicted enzyme related to lactoylglutathione lyase
VTQPFVWFHNHSDKPSESKVFYQELLGWKPADGPCDMTMFAGDSGPFAGLAAREGAAAGWLPYVLVPDLDIATGRAVALGAAVMQPRTKGPAGDFTVVRDPGGAAIALWQRG